MSKQLKMRNRMRDYGCPLEQIHTTLEAVRILEDTIKWITFKEGCQKPQSNNCDAYSIIDRVIFGRQLK